MEVASKSGSSVDGSNSECLICAEPEEKLCMGTTNCGHRMCVACVAAWFRGADNERTSHSEGKSGGKGKSGCGCHYKCPLCKDDIVRFEIRGPIPSSAREDSAYVVNVAAERREVIEKFKTALDHAEDATAWMHRRYCLRGFQSKWDFCIEPIGELLRRLKETCPHLPDDRIMEKLQDAYESKKNEKGVCLCDVVKSVPATISELAKHLNESDAVPERRTLETFPLRIQ